jgi:hypothetical protein
MANELDEEKQKYHAEVLNEEIGFFKLFTKNIRDVAETVNEPIKACLETIIRISGNESVIVSDRRGSVETLSKNTSVLGVNTVEHRLKVQASIAKFWPNV